MKSLALMGVIAITLTATASLTIQAEGQVNAKSVIEVYVGTMFDCAYLTIPKFDDGEISPFVVARAVQNSCRQSFNGFWGDRVVPALASLKMNVKAFSNAEVEQFASQVLEARASSKLSNTSTGMY